MKINSILIKVSFAIIIHLIPSSIFAQAPNLGTAANFVLFTSAGAVTNSGTGYLTLLIGNVGTNSAPTITGFGNINGQMRYSTDLVSGQCQSDLTFAYNQLNSATPTIFPATTIGNGDTLTAAVYSITNSVITLSGNLILDAKGNPNAVFIFKLQGALSSATNTKVKLINGALACNVFWKVEGAVNLASGTTMRGTIIANNGAINISSGDTLEGRALSTTGAITVSQLYGYLPIGCGSAILTGPAAPNLASTACYSTFTSCGANKNTGASVFNGDVGTNSGLTIGYNPASVTGTIHPIPDASTAAAKSDLATVYSYLSGLAPGNIKLLFPSQFGHNLELTPHTYLMNGAVTFTDTLILNAQGNADAVFVILVNGAFNTVVNSVVLLKNGAKAKNVYWRINGAVTINNNSIFNGTVVCTGAICVNNGARVNGRVLSTNGAVNISSANISIFPLDILFPVLNKKVCSGDSVKLILRFGLGYTYQWRRGSVNLVNNGHISGVNSDTLTIYSFNFTDTGSNYNVIISNTCGQKDTSPLISLSINLDSINITEPLNQVNCLGDTAKIFVKASGTNLVYQWRKGSTNLVNNIKYSGVNSDTLKINDFSLLDTSSYYNVVVAGDCAPNDTSINVSIMNQIQLQITSEPINQVICLDDTAKVSIKAAGTNLIYQWKKGSTALVNNTEYSGVNSDTLKINDFSLLDTSSYYNVIVTGDCAANDTSVNVSVMNQTQLQITGEPINQVICLGDTAKVSIKAAGTNLIYQWKKGSTALVNNTEYSGVNSDTLKINDFSLLDTSSYYNVIVTGDCAANDTSVNVSVMNQTQLQITSEPINQVICLGDSTKFNVIATGGSLNYQWRKGDLNLSNSTKISGTNSNELTIRNVNSTDTASNYNVVLNGICNMRDTSRDVSLAINQKPIITTEPNDKIACENDSTSFEVISSGFNQSYQWRKGLVNLTNNSQILGANSSKLTMLNLSMSDSGSNFNVIVSGLCNTNDTSINVSLKVNPVPIAIASSNSPVCKDSSIYLNSNIIDGSTHSWTGPNSYVSSSPSATIVSASALNAGIYSLIITANNCNSLPSNINVLINDCQKLDFFIPEAFSPNGDGINDVFFIRGLNKYSKSSIEIYNRWGEIIFSANPYLNNWNGTSTLGLKIGNTLPVSTYFYLLNLGDNSPIIRGSIYLNN